MKRILFLAVLAIILCSHDMFLKPRGYYLAPNTEAVIALYNGTWDRSDNVIDCDRMIDVSIISNGTRSRKDSTAWTEENKATLLHFTTGEEGTYVAGVSTHAKNIETDAKDFNEYLEHDGVHDMLQWRKDNGALNDDAVEKYSKHVKTIVQVGETRTTDWNVNLGYPIEFIPLKNPYKLEEGYEMRVMLLRNGKPLPNQLVYLGTPQHHHSHEDSEDHGDDHHHHDVTQLETDDKGRLSFKVEKEGIHYLRTIHMTQSDEAGLTHESNWATLSFEIGHGYVHDPVKSRKQTLMTIGGILLLSLIFYIYQKMTS